MRTVGKALRILDLFTEQSPALALSEIAAKSGIDRATCHRMLKSMSQFGYATQSPDTKKYSIGATVVRLAHIWEAVNPISAVLHASVAQLARDTGETAHASVIAGDRLTTIAVCEGTRLNRVHVPSGGKIEIHATASGLACLAFAREDFVARSLEGLLVAYTATTATDPDVVREMVAKVRLQGFSIADRSFDNEVVGIAAPIFGADSSAIGAVAVATPFSRVTDELQQTIARAVMEAGVRATRSQGGCLSPDFVNAYARMDDRTLADESSSPALRRDF